MSMAGESRWSLRRDPTALLAAAVVLAVYVAAVAWIPHQTFWSPDEGAKFVQMRAMHWDGGLRYEIPYRGRDLDPSYQLYPSLCRYGDFYPRPLEGGGVGFHWPIWFPLASRAAYELFGAAGLYVIPVLAGWSLCLLAGALAARFAARLAAPAILLTGLATPVAFYSVVFWEHTAASALGLGAVVLFARALERRAVGSVVGALLLLCAAVALRLEMIAFALAALAAVAVVRRPRAADLAAWPFRPGRRLWTLAAAAAGALAVYLVFANLAPRHVWNLETMLRRVLELGPKLPALPASLVQILINADTHQGPVLPGFVGWIGLLAVAAAGVAPWLPAPGLQALLVLVSLAALGQLGLLLALLPQPYLSLHGAITAAPYLVLGAWALAGLRRDDPPGRRVVVLAGCFYAIAGVALIVVLLTDLEGQYQTGLEWGARNVLSLYPLGVVGALAALDSYQRSARPLLLRRLVLLLSAALMFEAFLLEVRGVRMLRASREQSARWQQALPVDQPIVTDTWWLPLAMASFYTDHVVYCALDKAPLVPWAERARAQGVEHFTFASVTRFRPAAFAAAGIPCEPERQSQSEGLYVTSFRFLDAAAGASAAPGALSAAPASTATPPDAGR